MQNGWTEINYKEVPGKDQVLTELVPTHPNDKITELAVV